MAPSVSKRYNIGTRSRCLTDAFPIDYQLFAAFRRLAPAMTWLRDSIATRARAVPLARHAWARIRRRRYERRIQRFLDEKSGRADRLPIGAVYEATMRCNLHCEFCYVGDLLNIEGEWRQELTLDSLRRAFPDHPGFQVSLTGGEIFMRKDIMSVLDLFREKGYACGYLTTNGTIITEERAEALADLAAIGFLKHISVSIDGPGELHDVARGLKGTFDRTCAGLRRLQEAARRKRAPLRVSINTTVAHETLEALDRMVDVAEELGVDAIGLNHLMFSTPEEVAETVSILGQGDASKIATFVTRRPRAGRRASTNEGRAARGKVPRAQRPVRFPSEGPSATDGQLLHARLEAGRTLPLSLPPRARFLFGQGLLLPVHPCRGW